MAVLGQNLCDPARIYGPLPQNLFCGCSVISFSVQAGWNEQSSSMTIELVQDTCAGPRTWWDETLTRQTSESMTDPGFTFPEPGVAAYFRVEENPDGLTEAARGGFEYAGLVEGWTERNDPNGFPVYTVKLTDPRVVLENTQVIVNDYPGGTSGVWNLINAYGFVESLGTTCNISPAGGIGGVTLDNTIGNHANDRGMVWNDVRCAINTLTAGLDQALVSTLHGSYCREARIIYVGPAPADDGYGIIERDGLITDSAFQTLPNANLNKSEYLIDLSEIPFAPLYYRISGPNISLMEIISEVAGDAGFDYYIELLPVISGGKVLKIIKVRAAVRSQQPALGVLDTFIATRRADEAASSGGILTYTRGEEVRNEDNSIYLIGGAVRDAEIVDAGDIVPFFGVDTAGDLVQAQIVDEEYQIRLDTFRLSQTLNTAFAMQYNWITESELRAALIDIDSWREVCLFVDNDFAAHLLAIGHEGRINKVVLKRIIEGKVPEHAIAIANKLAPDAMDADDDKDFEMIYEYVRNFANEYYGKQWLVNAGSVCVVTDQESDKKKYSHNASTEGCWIDDSTSTVLGLTHDTSATDFFRDDAGKYQPIIRFPVTASGLGGNAGLNADPTRLGDDTYITDGTANIWMKAEVDERWVAGTPLAPAGNTVSFLLKGAGAVIDSHTQGNKFGEAFAALDKLLEGQPGVDAPIRIVDKSAVVLGMVGRAIAPVGALAPQVSHVQTYGPWGIAGLPGQVRLETDDGLVPWEYGSDNIMTQAALNKVNSSVTQMRKGERGSVAVAGFPNIPIGAELFSVDTASPPVSQGNQKYLGTRSYSTNVCVGTLPTVRVAMNEWTGEFGPNITSVSSTVGPNGFTTEYQFSTYTPAFGRFAKDNAERLKIIGQSRVSTARNIRAQQLLRRQVAAGNARGREHHANIGVDKAPKSSHHVMVGRYTNTGTENSSYRPSVNTSAIRQAQAGFQDSGTYGVTAMMSLDGLFRPASKSGDGGLTPYFVFNTGMCTGLADHSKQADGPILEYDRLSVTRTFLDALANPQQPVLLERSHLAASGHDIEILGRGATPPASGWTIEESDDGYQSDYRFMVHRGPIMIQQWGYDLCGKPVPNKIDIESDAESGKFVDSLLLDRFMDGWLQKPKSWPMAPLDLRLDRERGVWVPPQPPRIMHALPTGDCFLVDSGVQLTNTKVTYDASGSTVADPEGTLATQYLAWPWAIEPPTGMGKIPAYFDNVDCSWYAFPVNRLDVSSGIEDPSSNPSPPIFRDVKLLVFGSGFQLSFADEDCNNTVTIELTPP